MTAELKILDNMRNNKVLYSNTFFVIIVFILSPALSFPLLIWQIYHEKKYAFICLAILLGLWSFLMAPIGDMYRYSMDYYLYENLTFDQFKSMLLIKNDYLLSFTMYTLSYFGIPPDYSRFLYVTVGSLCILFLLYRICNGIFLSEEKNARFVLFIILFLNFKFSSLSFRFAFSSVLYLLGGIYLLVENKKKGYIILFIAVLNHISFIIFILPLLFTSVCKKFGSKPATLILIILIFTFSGTFVNDILLYLAPNSGLIKHALYYTDGVWSGQFLEDHSIGYRILGIINSIPCYICYFIFYYIFRRNAWSRWIVALLLLVVITAPYVVLKARCQSVAFLPIIFYIMCHIKEISVKIKNKILLIMLVSGVIYTGANLWGTRRELSMSQEQKLLTTNIIEILNHSYDYNWLKENVNEDGSPAKINY